MTVFSAVPFLGATITESTSLASLSVLATKAIGRYVCLSIARTKLGLASSITVGVLATVTFPGAAVTECTALAGLSILATETISGYISGIGQCAVAKTILTTSTAMLGVTSAPAAHRAAVTVAGVKTDLAVGTTLTVRGDIAGRATCAKVGGTVIAAVGGRVTAPALSGTAVSKGAVTTNELVRASTRTVRTDASRA